MQYLIGLHEFTTAAPFSASSITNFRKYITKEMINEVNEEMFRDNGSDNDGNNNGSGSISDEHDISEIKEAQSGYPNKGELLLDATCAPAYISYPTDVNLLNEAREKTEGIIDTLHAQTGNKHKPRTYRQAARWKYLRFIKQRKPRKATIRKAIRQQLGFVGRNLKHIDKMLQTVKDDVLSNNQKQWLKTIRELYRQQLYMYEAKTRSIKSRIVSINQPHVRPIVRGKVNASVEFGAKVSISMVDGYAFVDKIGWEAYNEESLLIPAIESYKAQYGFYPKAVLADKIYRNRNNCAYCKKHGIRLSGLKLGRPAKETNKAKIKQEHLDISARNAVEGKFGEGKTKYGLDRIMARLKGNSETVIALLFFCMNISKKLRLLFGPLLHLLKYRDARHRIYFIGVFE
jgi:hypothetical protein